MAAGDHGCDDSLGNDDIDSQFERAVDRALEPLPFQFGDAGHHDGIRMGERLQSVILGAPRFGAYLCRERYTSDSFLHRPSAAE